MFQCFDPKVDRSSSLSRVAWVLRLKGTFSSGLQIKERKCLRLHQYILLWLKI